MDSAVVLCHGRELGLAGVVVKPMGTGGKYRHVEGQPTFLRGPSDERFIPFGEAVKRGGQRS